MKVFLCYFDVMNVEKNSMILFCERFQEFNDSVEMIHSLFYTNIIHILTSLLCRASSGFDKKPLAHYSSERKKTAAADSSSPVATSTPSTNTASPRGMALA